MSNAARHAHATRVEVSVVLRVGDLQVLVEDDRVGVDASAARSGLRNLASRALELSGELVLDAGPLRGAPDLARMDCGLTCREGQRPGAIVPTAGPKVSTVPTASCVSVLSSVTDGTPPARMCRSGFAGPGRSRPPPLRCQALSPLRPRRSPHATLTGRVLFRQRHAPEEVTSPSRTAMLLCLPVALGAQTSSSVTACFRRRLAGRRGRMRRDAQAPKALRGSQPWASRGSA